MRQQCKRIILIAFSVFLLPVSWNIRAESEYDMYRSPSVAMPTMVLLDTSHAMACAPGQIATEDSDVACGYVLQGAPPFAMDAEKQAASRLAMVKAAFAHYSQTSADALRDVGLATYANNGGVIRVPMAANLSGGAFLPGSAFLQSLQSLVIDGDPTLVGGLLETANYFAEQAVVFGRKRETQGDPQHPDTALALRYAGFLPRWFTQTVSHPQSIVSGASQLRRDPACNAAIEVTGPAALLVPACMSEHYEIAPGQALTYASPDNRCLQRDSNEAESVPQTQLLLIVGQDIEQPGGLAFQVADKPLGVWIHRFLADDPQAEGDDNTCRDQAGIAENRTLESCTLAMVEKLRQAQHVMVSVIALGQGNEFLSELAAAGGGRYFSVQNQGDLESALGELLPGTGTNHTLESAVMTSTVMPVYGMTPQDAVFMTQFQPTTKRRWRGNLKRYHLQGTHGVSQIVSVAGDTSDTVVVACADGSPGCISATARSAWTRSVAADGDIVTRGGTADALPPLAQRKVLVQQGRQWVPLVPGMTLETLARDQQQLVMKMAGLLGWQGDNVVADANSVPVKEAFALYNRLAGADDNNVEYEGLKQLGQQPLEHRDQESRSIGATVFGAPVLARYFTAPTVQRNVLWWGATDGFIRAIDADSGEALAAMLPEAVLPAIVAGDSGQNGDVIAGLDAGLVVLQHDYNHDGLIRRSDGDHIYLYGGMRRGGRHVYGWDVTDPADPALLFDLSPQSEGFNALGFTWSTPLLTRLWIPGRTQPETVLVFGGGYDSRGDAPSIGLSDACVDAVVRCAAAIYVVQATGRDAGTLLWTLDRDAGQNHHTPVAELLAPITAPLRALDLDGNGVSDVLYALDLEGTLFRVQLPQNAEGATLPVQVVARLGEIPGDTMDSRFFFAPSVAVSASAGGRYQVSLAAGSGTITQPFSETRKAALYVLRDSVSPGMPPEEAAVTPSSSEAVWLSSETPANAPGARLLVLPVSQKGEKLAAAPAIVDHHAFFTTYVPPAPSTRDDHCTPRAGSQRLWALDINTGKPVLDNAGDINPAEATHYSVSVGVVHGTGKLVPLLGAGKVDLLQGAYRQRAGAFVTQPEKLRWKPLLSGPQVRLH